MNKRQSRHFAIACTGMAALAFLVLTADSHRQFPELTNARNITPEVSRGKDVWHDNNCINCHTLFGEGAYYAPDLTKITQLRGAAYLQAYMKNPADFYDEETHRRLMPKQDLTDENITDLIAFLDWVSKVDNQGWPPRHGHDFVAAKPAVGIGRSLAVAARGETGDSRQQPDCAGRIPVPDGRTRLQCLSLGSAGSQHGRPDARRCRKSRPRHHPVAGLSGAGAGCGIVHP
jgi:hypothetical protein